MSETYDISLVGTAEHYRKRVLQRSSGLPLLTGELISFEIDDHGQTIYAKVVSVDGEKITAKETGRTVLLSWSGPPDFTYTGGGPCAVSATRATVHRRMKSASRRQQPMLRCMTTIKDMTMERLAKTMGLLVALSIGAQIIHHAIMPVPDAVRVASSLTLLFSLCLVATSAIFALLAWGLEKFTHD